jgi:hypothetical protein
MMDTIFQAQITEGWLKVYMDDLLICNNSDKADMMKKILIVLKLLKEHDLFLKPEKCSFYVTKVDFLGFIIEAGKILMDPAKPKGILEWPAPTTVTQLRSFIGFCNFYHRFISHYSDKCAPLNRLLRKDQPWDWTEEQQVAFETMKAAYASEPVLLCPDYTKPFRLQCDASLVASGGVLLKDDTNGQEHPIAFFSKAHSPAERNYMTYNREFLAIILCLR